MRDLALLSTLPARVRIGRRIVCAQLSILLALILSGCLGAEPIEPTQINEPATQPAPTEQPDWILEGWDLVWHDEFEGETINLDNWTFDIGGSGWGNSESQFYTDRPENARIEDGMLLIEARQEDFQGRGYTSARLKTENLQAWAYGRIEARLKLPTGQGIWSAFWMLGENFTQVGWPRSGEIDIMENIGDPHTVYGTVHGPGYSGGNGIGSPFTLMGSELDQEFHTYAVEWEPGEIRWYVDETLFNKVTDTDVPGAWVFDHPFFIILNLAVGGVWPGYPDETTTFPQQYRIDYVRVYQDPALESIELRTSSIHVANIDFVLEETGDELEATVFVTVLTEDGEPVENAVVNGGWLGAKRGWDSQAKTDAKGIAGPFRAIDNPLSAGISFCVTDLTGSQMEYQKEENVITCVQVEP